jgi:hypothetical protein
MRFAPVCVVIAVIAAACAPQSSVAPRSPEVARFLADPSSLVGEVAAIRGLPDRRSTPILFDDDAAFAKALDAKAKSDDMPGTPSDTAGFLVAFGVPQLSRSGSGGDHDGFERLIDEQIIAFYHTASHTIHLRMSRLDDDDVTMVVAHEITHSLQHQNLPALDIAGAKDEDQRLALSAVLEGDAMLAMIAHVASKGRIPIKRALARVVDAVARDAFQRFAKANGSQPVLMSAPALIRQRLIFPYMRGLVFLGELYRAGGFPLVNQVYSHPPATSEQILHAEKYVAGEGSVAVRAPTPPPGYDALVSGQVGELQIMAVLERCLPADQARRAAAGWGGDAFTIARSGNNPALLWSTVWDTETDAAEFEGALRAYVSCTRAESRTSIFPLDDRVERVGNNVVLVRGIAGANLALAAKKLQGLAAAPPRPSPPLGQVLIPPRKVAAAFHAPYVSGGVYVNEQLGVFSPTPWGFSVEMPSPTSAVFEHDSAPAAAAGIELSEQLAVRETIDEVHGSLAAAVERMIGHHTLDYTGGQQVTLPEIGNGVDRAWRVHGTEAGLRAIVVPICQGTGSLVFWQFWTDPRGLSSVQQWLSGLRRTNRQDPPICAVLDP